MRQLQENSEPPRSSFEVLKIGHDIDRLACLSKKYLRSYLFHSLRSTAAWTPPVLLDDIILSWRVLYIIISVNAIYSTHISFCMLMQYYILYSGKFSSGVNFHSFSTCILHMHTRILTASVLLNLWVAYPEIWSVVRSKHKLRKAHKPGEISMPWVWSGSSSIRKKHGLICRLYCAIDLINFYDQSIKQLIANVSLELISVIEAYRK